MRKSWGFTEKILSGEKTIESRWYNSQYPPWNKITTGDTVYFKDSGMSVTIMAAVSKVIQFSDLNPTRVKDILNKYGARDGINKEELPYFFKLFKEKRRCILIFLVNPRSIPQFAVNKKGYGAMASWIALDSIDQIRKKID